ncbi:MAG: hypothetical protein RML75_10665 [Cyanobacteriota bacterium SKYGB_h_bin112]|nr:hypothetical protein [Cyanobacteriota bacterium SKYGB_h_bin112]
MILTSLDSHGFQFRASLQKNNAILQANFSISRHEKLTHFDLTNRGFETGESTSFVTETNPPLLGTQPQMVDKVFENYLAV